jgi:hypothetical protein
MCNMPESKDTDWDGMVLSRNNNEFEATATNRYSPSALEAVDRATAPGR